jgi:uncharacterized protein (DUF305 family)
MDCSRDDSKEEKKNADESVEEQGQDQPFEQPRPPHHTRAADLQGEHRAGEHPVQGQVKLAAAAPTLEQAEQELTPSQRTAREQPEKRRTKDGSLETRC